MKARYVHEAHAHPRTINRPVATPRRHPCLQPRQKNPRFGFRSHFAGGTLIAQLRRQRALAISGGAEPRIARPTQTRVLGHGNASGRCQPPGRDSGEENARYDSPFFDDIIARRGFTGEAAEQARAKYARFQIHDADILANERSVFDWACKQTYIAMANMMTAAAALGIDSCPIEGFDYAEVNQFGRCRLL